MAGFAHHRTHPGAGAIVVAAYVAIAIVLALQPTELVALVFGTKISPVSSASASAMLSAVAAGMMALTGIVFSLVFVALQYSGSAYSPRLIRLLGHGPFLAHALGVFAGTFVYALVALRRVDLAGAHGIDLSVVAIAFIWLVASLVVLALLLPRVRGLALDPVLAVLQIRGLAAADRAYPDRPRTAGRELRALPLTAAVRHRGRPMYVTGIATERLVRAARDADAVIEIPTAIGDPIVNGEPLARIRGGRHAIPERLVRDAIWLGHDRELDNDPAYAIRLLVDVAIRALSPAVNDPSTAVSVLDELDGLLRDLARRDLSRDRACDDQGVVRLVRAVATWEDLVTLALTEIVQYGRGAVQIERRMAALVHDLLADVPPDRRAALEQFARHGPRDRQGLGHALG